MTKPLIRFLKWLREEYYFSRILSTSAKPVYTVCSKLAQQISAKVRRNGVTICLPNGNRMQLGRNAGVDLASIFFWRGLAGFENETSKTLQFFFQQSAVFVDVGANCGVYSLLAALSNPKIRVVAFEPLRPIYDRLMANVELNHLAGKVACENLALSSRSGTATLYLPASEGLDLETTGTLATDSWQVRQHAEPLAVEAVRFDEYESRHPMQVDLIKIDVEDFEADVLRGMEGTIRRDRPFIVCEILPRNSSHKNEPTRRIVQELGYTPYWITPSGYIRVSRFDFERDSLNFLLSPVSVPGEVLTDLGAFWELKQKTVQTVVA
jgi:FkbM family methyltransferase